MSIRQDRWGEGVWEKSENVGSERPVIYGMVAGFADWFDCEGVFRLLFFLYTFSPMHNNRKIIHVDMDLIMVPLKRLLANTEAGKKKVRLLGISESNFLGAEKENKGWVQLPLTFGYKE